MAETFGLLLLTGLTVETAAGTAAVGALTIGATGISVATVVGTAALLGTSIAVAYATQPGVPKPSEAGGTQAMKQAIAPRPFGYGRCRLAGAYMLYESDALYSYDVVALHQGRIGGIVHYFLNEDLVWLNASSYVARIADPSTGSRYGTSVQPISNVLIEHRLGLGTETAYVEVVSALPELWSNDHRGDGVASLLLRCKRTDGVAEFTTAFPRGLPKLSVVADLAPVFDPRNPAHDREDPDTWAVSSNSVLNLLDYLTNPERGGPGQDWDVLVQPVLAALMAEADICDEPVTRADGSTEPRYTCNGRAFLNTDPADVQAAILATCDGWMCERGDGTLALTVGKYRAPTVTIAARHILGLSVERGVPDEDVVNEFQITWTAPGNDYREAPGAPWRDLASIAEIGRVRSRPLQLTWVQSHSQARRLAKRAMARQTASLRGTLLVSLFGVRALGERWLRVQDGDTADLSDAVVEVTRAKVDLANARVELDYVLVNPNEIEAFDAAQEEGETPTFDSRLTPTPTGATWSASGGAIRVLINEPPGARTDLTFAVEYKLAAADTWTRQVFTTPVDLGATLQMTTAVVPAGTYDVRIASIGAGAGGALSPWTTEDSVVI